MSLSIVKAVSWSVCVAVTRTSKRRCRKSENPSSFTEHSKVTLSKLLSVSVYLCVCLSVCLPLFSVSLPFFPGLFLKYTLSILPSLCLYICLVGCLSKTSLFDPVTLSSFSLIFYSVIILIMTACLRSQRLGYKIENRKLI